MAASTFCVSITHCHTDPDRITVGFVVANAALGSDKDTLVFLSADGVWAAVKGEAGEDRRRRALRAAEGPHRQVPDGRRTDPRLHAVPEEAGDRRGPAGPRRQARGRRGARGVAVQRLALRRVLSEVDRRATAGALRPDRVFDGGDLDCGSGPRAPPPRTHAGGAGGRRPRDAEPRADRAGRPPPLVPHGRPRVPRRASRSGATTRYFVRRGAGADGGRARARGGQGARPGLRVAGARPRRPGPAKSTVYCRNLAFDVGPAGELRGAGRRTPPRSRSCSGRSAATWRPAFATECARDGLALDDVELDGAGPARGRARRLGPRTGRPRSSPRSRSRASPRPRGRGRVRAAWERDGRALAARRRPSGRRRRSRSGCRSSEGPSGMRTGSEGREGGSDVFTVTQVGSWPRSKAHAPGAPRPPGGPPLPRGVRPGGRRGGPPHRRASRRRPGWTWSWTASTGATTSTPS